MADGAQKNNSQEDSGPEGSVEKSNAEQPGEAGSDSSQLESSEPDGVSIDFDDDDLSFDIELDDLDDDPDESESPQQASEADEPDDDEEDLSIDIEFDDEDLLETTEIEEIEISTGELIAVDETQQELPVAPVSERPPIPEAPVPKASPPQPPLFESAIAPEADPPITEDSSASRHPLFDIPGVELLGLGSDEPKSSKEQTDSTANRPDREDGWEPERDAKQAVALSDVENTIPDADVGFFKPELLAPPPDPVDLAGEAPITDTAPAWKPFVGTSERGDDWAPEPNEDEQPAPEQTFGDPYEVDSADAKTRTPETDRGFPGVPRPALEVRDSEEFRAPGQEQQPEEPAESPTIVIRPYASDKEEVDPIALGVMETSPVVEMSSEDRAEWTLQQDGDDIIDLQAETANSDPSLGKPFDDGAIEDLFVPIEADEGDLEAKAIDLVSSPYPLASLEAGVPDPTTAQSDVPPPPMSDTVSDMPESPPPDFRFPTFNTKAVPSEPEETYDEIPPPPFEQSEPPPPLPPSVTVAESVETMPLPPPVASKDESALDEALSAPEDQWGSALTEVFTPSEQTWAPTQVLEREPEPELELEPVLRPELEFGPDLLRAESVAEEVSEERLLPEVEPLPLPSPELASAPDEEPVSEAKLPEEFAQPGYELPSELSSEDGYDDFEPMEGIRITSGPSSRTQTTNFDTGGRRLSTPEVEDRRQGSFSEPVLQYFDDMHALRPGPAGIGAPEHRSCAVEVTAPADVALKARASEFGGKDDPGAFRVVVPSIELNEALISSLSTWADRPVVLVGSPGSGKSHALNNLAAAFVDRIREGSTSRNPLVGLMLPLDGPEGPPIPVRFDLASVAGLKPTDGESLLQALVSQRHLPEELLAFEGPVVVLADGLDDSMNWSGSDIDPLGLLCDLLANRPNWRAVAATRPLGGKVFLDWGGRFGPFPVVEIIDMEGAQAREMTVAWSTVARPRPAEPKRLAQILPPEIAACPRLIQMLLGQWLTAAVSIEAMVRLAGTSGVGRLILDGVCKRTEVEAGTVHTRQDLQILADIASGMGSHAVPLADVQQLSSEGFVRDSLVTLESTGIVEVRLVRGDRPDGVLAFTHPLFQEILLAEYLEQEFIAVGLRRELDALLAELQPVEYLVPFQAQQVRRMIEVANILLSNLTVHLRPDLLEGLGTWLWYQLKRKEFPESAHYPRLLGVCWILAATLNRLGGPYVQAFQQLKEQCSATLMDLLAQRGEEALRQILYRL